MPEHFPPQSDLHVLFSSSVALNRVIATRKAKNFGMKFIHELRMALDDEYYEVRSNAALSLGILNDEKSIPKIMELLSDEVEEVRYNSARALGYLRSPKSIPSLLKSLSDFSRETRRLSTWSLSQMPQAELKKEIKKHLTSISTEDINQSDQSSIQKIDIARGIMEAVGEFSGNWIKEVLKFGLMSQDLEMARLAAISIGKHKINEFIPDLMKKLDTTDDDFRWGLVYSLCQFNFTEKPRVLEQHIDDPYDFIREQVALHLYQVAEDLDIRSLIIKLSKDESPIVRSAICQSIKQLDNHTAPLEFLLKDENPYVRQNAVYSLSTKNPSFVRPILKEMFDEEDDELVRVAIINTLDKLTSK